MALQLLLFTGIYRNLVQNPFMCNCHLAWFSEWLKTKGLSGSSPRCAGPTQVKDVLIKELPKFEFKCRGENYCFLQYALLNFY